MLTDALLAGVIGYGLVVLFFVVVNLAQGRSPFYTAALLGSAVFGGLRDPAQLLIEPGMVLAFNGIHLVAFLLFGLFAAWLVYETELHPEFWYLGFVLFLSAAVLSYAVVLAFTVLVGALVSPWLVVASTAIGALGMAGYLAGVHRPLWRFIATEAGRDEAVPRVGRAD